MPKRVKVEWLFQAPKKAEQEYENLKKKGVLIGAQTNNANASAAAHNRSNSREFRAYDKNGNVRYFSDGNAALEFARQEGTIGNASTSSSSRSVGNNGVTKTTKTTDKPYAAKPAKKNGGAKKGWASGLKL